MELSLHVIMHAQDVVLGLVEPAKPLHNGPVDMRPTHVFDCGVQCPKDSFAYIHRVVDLTSPLDCMVPHMANGPFAMMPSVLQLTLPHFTYGLDHR